MSHIFLSYSRRDAARAQHLAEALEAQGLSVWWDRTIPPGKTFDQVIEEALEEANWVIVLWSSHSVESNWVKAEASEALSRDALVPVLIEKVKAPLAFRRIEAAELQDWDGDISDPEFRQLVSVLGGQAPPPKPKPDPRPPGPRSPDPTPPPPTAGMSSRTKVFIGLGVAFVALIAVGIGMVSMIGQQFAEEAEPRFDPPPPYEEPDSQPDSQPDQEAERPREPQQPAAETETRTQPQERPRVQAPTTGNIVLQYLGDEYGCALDLQIRVGNQSFIPTGNTVPISNLPLGPVQYSASGTIACPYIGACSAIGSGTLQVFDGAVYNLVWQNTAPSQCQITFAGAG